jgi:hypothetical protein
MLGGGLGWADGGGGSNPVGSREIRPLCDGKFYRRLDEVGGWQARCWWLYRGLVVPEWFVDVEFLDKGEIGIHEQKALEVVEKSGSLDEAIRRMGGRQDQDFSLDLLSPDMWNLD